MARNQQTLPEPLRGVQAKLERAKAHYDVLEKEVDRVFRGRYGDPVVLTGELHREADGKTGFFMVKVAHVKRPPIEVGVHIGDVVHNLRSALDHIAWQLGRLNGKGSNPHRGTVFPICRVPADFVAKPTREALKHIHPEHRALIEECQPYHGGGFELLSFLNQLSRTDKHQVVNTAFTAQDEGGFGVSAERDCELRREGLVVSLGAGPMEVGAEVAQIPIRITGPSPSIDMSADGAIFVAFGNGMEVFQTLSNIGHAVNMAMFKFVPVFDTPDGKSSVLGWRTRLTPGRAGSSESRFERWTRRGTSSPKGLACSRSRNRAALAFRLRRMSRSR